MTFTKRLLFPCLLLLALLPAKALSQCGTNIDLGTWVQEGAAVDGSWNVTNGGNTVKQTINGDPTFYVSPDSFLNVIITGDISVETTNDNDFVGFVFGYSSPDSNTANNDYDFYLFDWKQGDQTNDGQFGAEGYFLTKVDGIALDVEDAFWGHNDPAVDVIGSVTGNNEGWVDFQTYSFALTYTNTRVVIVINNDTLFDEYGCYEPGRFGFYNYSQPDVEYSNFAYQVAAAFEVVTPTVCLGDSALVKAVSDSCANPSAQVNNTIVGWNWDLGDGVSSNDTNVTHLYNNAGTYPVRLVVTDYLGCTDTAYNTVTVLEAGTDLVADTAICAGDSITFDAGTNASSYLWNTGETTQTITVDSASTYSVIASIPFGCADTDTVVLSIHPLPTQPLGNDTSICSNDSLTLDALNPGSTYVWQDGSTGQTLVAKTSGTYYVTITNASECSAIDTLVLTVNPVPTVDLGTDTSFCAPDSITLDAGNAGASFLWHDGVMSQTRSAPDSAIYSVTVTDGNTCSAVDSIGVTVYPLIVPGITVATNPVCTGDTTQLTASGGETYVWQNDPGLSAYDTNITQAFPVSSTTYLVTVTDSNGCADTSSVTISVNPLPTLTLTASDDTLCKGDSALLVITGADNYSWDNLAALSFISNDSAFAFPDSSTAFTIIGTDSNGCVDTTQIAIHVDTLPVVSVSPATASICLYDSVGLKASGAATYAWSPNYEITALAGDSVTVHPNTDTTYYVTGTDANGCQADTSVFIEVFDLPTVSLVASNPVICFGDSSGILASGATSYAWTFDASLSATVGDSVIATPADTTVYEVVGTDINGCKDTNTVTIAVNQLPILTATPSIDTICLNDSTNILLSGADSYVWSNTASLNLVLDDSVFAKPQVSTAYTVTATDLNGCVDTLQVVVNVDTLPVVSVSPATASICLYDSVGLNASGAATYAWSPNYEITALAGDSVTVHPNIDTTYYVTGTDANGCQADTSVFIEVFDLPVVSLVASNPVICFGDSSGILASGATSYAWTFDASLSATVGDSVIATPADTTVYEVVGTDINGCKDTNTVTIAVNQLPVLTATPSIDTICLNDSTNILLTGADSYVWSNTASLNLVLDDSVFAKPQVSTNYSVTATDLNGCVDTLQVVVNVDTLPVVSVSPATASICLYDSVGLKASGAATYAWSPNYEITALAGDSVTVHPNTDTTYYVTGTDANGCQADTSVFIEVFDLPTVSLVASNPVICFGDSSGILASGATSYAWTFDASLSATVGDSVIATPADTTVYEVVGTDINGCRDTNTITIAVNQLPVLTATPSIDTICLNDSTNILLSGADSYVWSNTASLNLVLDDSVFAKPQVSTTYTVTATDLNGCVDTLQVVVNVDTLPVVSVNPSTENICLGQSKTLIASGAQTYSWSPGNGLSSNSAASVVASPSVNTVYTVVGTDGNGCTGSATSSIVIDTLPIITASPIDTFICPNDTVALTAQGAVTYEWISIPASPSIFGTTVNVAPQTPTEYLVVGTDANGCAGVGSTNVFLDTLPEVSITLSNAVICHGDTMPLTATNASTYQWAASSALSTLSGPTTLAYPLATTVFSVTGTDLNDCSSTFDTTIVVDTLPVISVNPPSDAICVGENTQLTASGAVNYTWSPSTGLNTTIGNTVTSSALDTITYTVTGTDGNGCENDTTVIVNVTPLPVLTLSASDDTVCTLTADTLFAQGANVYQWSTNGSIIEPTQSSIVVSPAQTQIYTVLGTGAGGCQSSTSIVVNVHAIPSYSAGEDVSKCVYDSVQIVASGGDFYAWSPGIGLTDSTIADPFCSVESTTIYTAFITDGFECTYTDQVKVTVNPQPLINPGPDRAICETKSTELGGSPTGPNGASFLWVSDQPTLNLSDSVSTNPIATPDSTTNYTLIATSAQGCVDSATVQVKVNFIPVLEIISSPPHICRGDTDTLFVTPGNTLYQWTGTADIIDSLPGLIVVAPKEDADFLLTATDTNGCVNTLAWSVSVKDRPRVSAGVDVEMCKFDSVQMQAENDSLLTYRWSNAEFLEDATNVSTMAFPDETTTLSLTGTDSNGCSTVSEAEVRVYELPYVDAGDDILNCDMGSVMLGGLPSGPDGANYAWSPSTGLNDSTAANPVSSITERLTYTLTVSTDFGCTDSDTVRVTSDCWSLYAPSAFSPDQNNLNDEYFIKYYRIKNPKLLIWDRFGHLVFQTLNLDRGWNGSVNGKGEAPMGVYYWLLTFEDENGRALSQEGTVTLVR